MSMSPEAVQKTEDGEEVWGLESELEDIDERRSEALRRYGEDIMDYAAGVWREKYEGAAVVSHIKIDASDVADNSDINSEQVIGRALRGLEEILEADTSRHTLMLDYEELPEIHRAVEQISDLPTYEEEWDIIEGIVREYQPVSGPEIRQEFAEEFYEMDNNQMVNRIKNLDDVFYDDGSGGYVLKQDNLEETTFIG